MLTQKEIKEIKVRKEAILRLYGESMYRRMEAGHIPPEKLVEILKFPTDDN